MRGYIKLLLYILFLAGFSSFGYLTHHKYKEVIGASEVVPGTDRPLPKSEKNLKMEAKAIDDEEVKNESPFTQDYSSMMGYGVGLFICIIGLSLLVARDVAGYFGNRASRMVYNDAGEDMAIKNADYEKADAAWRNGEYIQAIQLLREYLKKNPREVHAALRIAEIYEKDMGNHLAAALEYEEVLKQKKLNRERWGWTAIKLANIYSGKLNNSNKALELLHRIVNEYGGTKAAEKAQKRLDQVEGIEDAEAAEPS